MVGLGGISGGFFRAVAGIVSGALSAGSVWAAELVIPSMTYRTGPYASGGVPASDGFADYITLLNERDGGINGKRLRVVECEYGYDTARGIACFEELAEKGGLVFHPLSTGLTYALLPRIHQLRVPMVTIGYGFAATADGAMYPYAFNFPAHYWHAATTQVAHLKELEGGSLIGRRIVHLYHESGFGREPIQTLEALAKREGFELVLVPVAAPGLEQTQAWAEIAAVDPDYILFWGWGEMNAATLEAAIAKDFPLDRMVGIWWSAQEADLKPLGGAADGYKAVTFHGVGTGFKIFNELNRLVYQTGKARGKMNNIGEGLYNRGVISAVFSTEAIRLAMELHGTEDVTPAMVRDGLERLSMDASDLERLGVGGFVAPVQISCENHAGDGRVAIKQWNGAMRKWELISGFYEPISQVIEPQIIEASEAFAIHANMKRKGC